MTISTEDASITHTGNGVLTEFSVPFKFLSADHLQVELVTVLTGDAEVLSSAAYSVTGAGAETGGTVTYNPGTPISSSYQLYIHRVLPLTQEVDLEREGGFFPEVIEEALDRLTMQIQMIRAELEAAVGGEISAITRNVAGPASSVVSDFASFNNTTGTLLKNSGYSAADFAAANHTHADDWTQITKAADLTRASTTTLASDADLTFAMAANSVYLVEATLYIESLLTSGFKVGITGPASPTLLICTGTDVDSAGNIAGFGVTSYTTLRANTPVASEYITLTVRARIANGATAGSFAFQFAQNVSNAAAATLYKGSFMKYKLV